MSCFCTFFPWIFRWRKMRWVIGASYWALENWIIYSLNLILFNNKSLFIAHYLDFLLIKLWIQIVHVLGNIFGIRIIIPSILVFLISLILTICTPSFVLKHAHKLLTMIQVIKTYRKIRLLSIIEILS